MLGMAPSLLNMLLNDSRPTNMMKASNRSLALRDNSGPAGVTRLNIVLALVFAILANILANAFNVLGVFRNALNSRVASTNAKTCSAGS